MRRQKRGAKLLDNRWLYHSRHHASAAVISSCSCGDPACNAHISLKQRALFCGSKVATEQDHAIEEYVFAAQGARWERFLVPVHEAHANT